MLEDLSCKLDVMVWARVFASTRDLWTEGYILLVDGKVKIRADKPQLVCEHVRIYNLEDKTLAKKVVAPKFFESPKATEETVKTPGKTRRLTVRLKQTGDEAADVKQLHDVMDILNDYPGDDVVSIIVDNGTKVFRLKMPHMHIGICSMMMSLLEVISDMAEVRSDARGDQVKFRNKLIQLCHHLNLFLFQGPVHDNRLLF